MGTFKLKGTRDLLGYALGRAVTLSDQALIEEMVLELNKSGGRLSAAVPRGNRLARKQAAARARPRRENRRENKRCAKSVQSRRIRGCYRQPLDAPLRRLGY